MNAKTPDIPSKYSQGWLAGLDSRTTLAKDLRKRYQTICNDLGGVATLSYAQKSLVERALWLERFLVIQEQDLASGREFDAARWIQASNSLLGLFRTLGLERRAKDVPDLQSYINEASK